MNKQLNRIIVKGGVLSPGELKYICESIESLGLKTISFGSCGMAGGCGGSTFQPATFAGGHTLARAVVTGRLCIARAGRRRREHSQEAYRPVRGTRRSVRAGGLGFCLGGLHV